MKTKDCSDVSLVLAVFLAAAIYLATPLMSSTALGWFEAGSISAELLKGMPSAFVALVIGLIAAYIAWQQWKVGHAKVKLDLFDRRHAIFDATWTYLSAVLTHGTKNYADPSFSNLFPQAHFLFGPEIREYMREASGKLGDLWVIEQEWGTEPEKHMERVRERSALMKWFADQASNGCREKFAPYLDLSAWR